MKRRSRGTRKSFQNKKVTGDWILVARDERLGDIRLPHGHFERSREIFVIRTQALNGRKSENGKPVIRREGGASAAIRGSRFPYMCRALFRFPHLSFIPPVPYPPLRGTFPSRGRLTIRGKPVIADLRASPDLYCGEAATTTLNPEPLLIFPKGVHPCLNP